MPSILAALALLAYASPGVAQTNNPNIIAFVPSPHHSTTLSTGQPAVSRYDLTFYRADTTERVLTVALGKPAPQSDGLIRVDFTDRMDSWPLAGVQVVARVTAVGPAGAGTSTPSNTFVYNCAFSLSTASDSVAAAGGTGMVEVVAGTLCGWSASSSSSWLTITSGSSGVATGWVAYTVAPNTGTTSRTATLTIAGVNYTVTQAAGSSQVNVPPTVKIRRPTADSIARIGRPLKIVVEASDADGIAKVEFYANGTRIGTLLTGSYVTWTPRTAGTYTLTAVAEDRRGARTTSAPITITGQ